MSGRHRSRGRAGRGLLILLLVLVLTGTGVAVAYRYVTGASGPSRPVSVRIPGGATAEDVGRILHEAGVIRSALGFRVAARLEGVGSSLQAGTYDLLTNMTVPDVLDALEGGPILETVEVTFPEGLELKETTEVAADSLGLNAKELQRLATSGEFSLPPYLPEDVDSVEGFLFPKTYEFSTGVDERGVIERLLAQFEQEASILDWGRAEELGLTPYEAVIVASMIEREARADDERPDVSAVIHNRLREGMPLQIDATIQYALPEENRLLTEEDYQYESPYNTYLHAGLPPTPIASPGLASLEAALNPADVDYLYFLVVDPETGRHEFAETYEEFLRLKEEAGL
ncbi:MAG TPA: endolytic transglycosylase MltG [Actinomycetota bacterium]|nr:endolytic transglycosylase MltG [Actinomycetota bacterium]